MWFAPEVSPPLPCPSDRGDETQHPPRTTGENAENHEEYVKYATGSTILPHDQYCFPEI